MTQQTEPEAMKTKVLATFEIEPRKLQKLKKLALEHERSYAFILRKLVDQAIEKGDFNLSAPTNEVQKEVSPIGAATLRSSV